TSRCEAAIDAGYPVAIPVAENKMRGNSFKKFYDADRFDISAMDHQLHLFFPENGYRVLNGWSSVMCIADNANSHGESNFLPHYSVGPMLHGANSSSPTPLHSLLVFFPEATARISSKICWPTTCTGVPSRMTPALMSMSSIMC